MRTGVDCCNEIRGDPRDVASRLAVVAVPLAGTKHVSTPCRSWLRCNEVLVPLFHFLLSLPCSLYPQISIEASFAIGFHQEIVEKQV